MRIGIDARMYGTKSTTGIGAYIKNLTDNLFLIDQKNEYILFMKDPAYSEFNPPSKRIKKVKVDIPWYSFSEQIKLPKILLKHKLDLIHFPHFNVPIIYPKKFITTIHDITPKFFPGPNVKKSLIRKIGYKLTFFCGINRSKKIITISNYTKDKLIKHFNLKPEKIKLTYLGFNNNFKPIRDQNVLDNINKKYNISKPFIFFVGVWRDHKNIPGLVTAFNILKSEYKLDYQLVLGGQTDERYPEIKQAIKNSPFEKDIITTGYISDDDLPAIYSNASLFAFPSFSEGFGIVALEAMACGTPVVASNNTSLPEILQDAAIYFNPYNSKEIAEIIKKVITNPEIQSQLRDKGFNQIKKYNWQDTAKKTLAVYETS